MSTLIIQAPGIITTPYPSGPGIPDTTSGIYWTLDARTLELAEGASVSSWIADGPAPLVDRTFNARYIGWSAPTFSVAGGPGGNKTLLFNGTQQLANPSIGATQEPQPISFAFMCKSTAFAATQSRILTAGNQIIGPGAAGYYASNATQSRLESGDSTADWIPLVVVFNGAQSKIKAGNHAIVTGNTGTAVNNRNTLGGQESTLSGVGLVGGIAYARCYNRALKDADIESISYQLKQQFGLA